MASIYDTAGTQQAAGTTTQGTGGLFGAISPATNFLFGGQNSYQAQTPWLDTTQSAQWADAAAWDRQQQELQARALQQAMQGGGVVGANLAAGQAQAGQAGNLRGVSAQQQVQIQHQTQQQAELQAAALQQQMQQQAQREYAASLMAQRNQAQASQAQSLQEALANQQAAGQINMANAKIQQGNADRSKNVIGNLISGVAGGMKIGGMG